MIPGARRGQSAVFSDFSGGLNTSVNPFLVGRGESPNMMNVTSGRRKSLIKRLGRSRLNSSALSETNGNGITYFRPKASDEKLVAHFGTKLFKMDGLDGTFDEIRMDLKNDISEMTTYIASEGGDLKNFVVVANRTPSPLIKWDGVESTADLFNAASTTPAAKHVISWNNRLFVSGIDGEPQRFQFTDFQSFDFAAANFVDIETSDGEGLEGWGILRANLYAFKRGSIHKISFLGGNPLLQVSEIQGEIGCVSARTIKNITFGGEEYLIFLGSDKNIYLFNGYSVVPISEKIEDRNDLADFSLNDLNDVALKDAWAANDNKNKRIYFYLALGGDTSTTHRLTYDYHRNGAFYVDDNMTLSDGVLFQTAEGERFQVAQNDSGRAFFMDNSNTDDGTTIAALWQSPPLDPVSTEIKKQYYVSFYTRGSSQAQVTFQHRSEFGNTFKTPTNKVEFSTNNTNNGTDDFLGTFTLGTDLLGGVEVIESTFDVSRIHSQLDFKITDSNTVEPFELLKIEAYNRTLGRAVGEEFNIT